jgi:hypothetical protein
MLSWNEIRDRATKFADEWASETREAGGYQIFWHEFFAVFGVKSRSVAIYQEQVKKLDGNSGFIDLFWPGTLIVEHKSTGHSLDSAFLQASNYMISLPEEERPRYIIVSDYRKIRLYDLENAFLGDIKQHEFLLKEFPKHIKLFGFIAGYEVRHYEEQNPVNKKAVRLIVQLYRALASGHYPKEALSQLLVRLVFCFFADDTGIFDKDTLQYFLQLTTKEDGTGFGEALSSVFEVLNTEDRQENMNDLLASLPYVNGGLFAGHLPMPFFNGEMREEVIKAAKFDWGAVSPAIFGSMFQFVMDEDDESKRHDIGAHYTSEKNIRKVIDGLFLDDLKTQFKAAGQDKQKLKELWEKIGAITLLDPACGCGNFLVVAYRELRRLELEILKRLYEEEKDLPCPIETLSKLSIERMYGIELEAFPAEIAKLSLYVADHLSNVELGLHYGRFFRKLPLREQPHILCANALTTDWATLVPKEKLSYILGNPPFIGSKIMTDEQRTEIVELFGNKTGGGVLDYVSGWYLKAAEYIQNTDVNVAFVSTNSITQGEQVGILWSQLTKKYSAHIQFAHRTFKWTNEAPGKAAVYCVIVGFGLREAKQSRLYEYEDIRGEPHEVLAKHINPYLVDALDVFIESRSKPICDIPEMKIGNKPIDGGQYLFTAEEKDEFLEREPKAELLFRRWIGSDEFINGWERWCLWLGDRKPEQLRGMPEVMRRVEAVKQYRELSKSKPTQKLAGTPTQFHIENIPTSTYLLVPRVSSESRRYIPIGFIKPEILASDSVHTIPNATLYHFGVLESEMHMAWMRTVCGRLKSDYRYSKDIVYNNFPWPEKPTAEQKKEVEEAAQMVLDTRKKFSESTLADLYDPNTMPKELLDAHHALDRAVDACYGKKSFKSEPERLEFLFELYQKYLNEEAKNIIPKKVKNKI